MAEEGQIIVPHVVVDRAEYTEVLKRLDEKVGRDIGILYGIVTGLVIALSYVILTGITI